MKTHTEPPAGSEDDLRAENEVLKLKLEMDHGMVGFGAALGPKAENEWLKSVYDFEVMLKSARGITIFELIGRPAVKRWDTLNEQNVSVELKMILDLLEKNGIVLQNLEHQGDLEYYRVLTEEFLPKKFGDFGNGPFMPPMMTWFGKERQ